MAVVVKLVTALGGAIVVGGLISVLFGWRSVYQGNKNDNPQKVDTGIEAMVLGGITAGITGTITAAIIAALNNLPK
ncbi:MULTISPECIES: hypothetical protein [Leuconostoc]|uniref:Uncharacterized protein n=1 Tax=Leuconostoc inhae TaxID=178001 RepID=A0AAN2QUC6_9LACO|nr:MULTISPECIES: hypothetical protein [Leuconostoc]MBZ5947837.1 hypothetical protein [Leuconostoc gasicomitatum]MBZ5955675.1 hypothetical protein [Leuconostoc gasicomitatum]MBZ5960707.1 hypothetical protein [Leuconostoc gasicomitatum]MBZ5979913.1 hypothetical protein [Leuconostoc gasicomitatum]MBZ5983289.1 hypothetical protein [Leuconostoc gasicomitatum]